MLSEYGRKNFYLRDKNCALSFKGSQYSQQSKIFKNILKHTHLKNSTKKKSEKAAHLLIAVLKANEEVILGSKLINSLLIHFSALLIICSVQAQF